MERIKTATGCVLLTVGLLLAAVPNLFSLTVARITVAELTEQSSLVVLGRVVDIRYQWEDQRQSSVNTVLTVEVSRYLKGRGGATVTVKQLGGRIGDFGDEVSGTPSFDVNDEVILFLVAHNGDYWIHSIALGAFNILTENDGQQYILNDLRTVSLVDPVTHAPVNPAEAFPLRPLNEFISEILAHVNSR